MHTVDETSKNDQMLTPAEMAALLNVSVPTLARWRVTGGGPPFIKLGVDRRSSVRYRLSAIREYLRRAERRSTSDPGPDAR